MLVVCSFAIERTSYFRRLSAMLINGSKLKSSARTILAAAFSSAAMNNTAVVATLLGVVKNNKLINPGKLLLPLSYAAILGGTLTLVGTSTNLIVNSMFIEQGNESLAFFDFTLIGISVLTICLVVIFLRAQSLPNVEVEQLDNQGYLLEAKIEEGSKLIGKTVQENGLRDLEGLFLVELVRRGRLVSPVAPDDILLAGDKLIFTGDVSKVKALSQFDGLVMFAETDGFLRDNLTEVIIKPDSVLVGRSLKYAGFRARFDAAVVAIKRDGASLSGKLGEMRLQAGDVLVLAAGNDFTARPNLTKNFYIVSGYKPDNMLSGWRNYLTLFGFIGVIFTSVLTEMSLLTGLLFYVAALIASQSLTINEVKRRFPIEISLIVIGALSLANAIENTGLANTIATSVESMLAGQSVYVAFIAIYIITVLVTELVTNNAAAALLFPIAYNIALGIGVDPLPFVMAVAFAASCSFVSPYGYQTNVMVFNASSYRLKDIVKFGLPISIIYSAVVLYLIPIVFPFSG